MKRFDFTKHKGAAEGHYVSLKEDIEWVEQRKAIVDFYFFVKNNDPIQRGSLERSGIRFNSFSDGAIMGLDEDIFVFLGKEAYSYLENEVNWYIDKKWIDEFFNFLRNNPASVGYLYPKSLSDVIMFYNEHKEDYQEHLSDYIQYLNRKHENV